MTAEKIILGGDTYTLEVIPFGRLRELTQNWDAALRDLRKPGAMEAAITVYAAALGKAEEDIEQIPATVSEITSGLLKIGLVSGMLERRAQPEGADPLDQTGETAGT